MHKKPLPSYREHSLLLQTLAKFHPQPTWLPNPADEAEIYLTSDGLVLRVSEPGCGMKWSLDFSSPIQVAETPYLLIEYCAVGISSAGNDPFISIAPRKADLPESHYYAAWLNELIADGKWRQLLVEVPEPTQRELATMVIQVQAESKVAEVVIRNIKFVNRPPEPHKWLDEVLPKAPMEVGRFFPLEISDRCNIALRQLNLDLPVKEWRFQRRNIIAAGIPFVVSQDEKNAIAPETDNGVGTVSVPLGKVRKASEAYLLLAASLPRWEEPSYVGYGGGPLTRIYHPHRFFIEVIFQDGSNEVVFPLRLLSRRTEIIAGLDVYVIPLGKPVKELKLHDRMRHGDFALCGLTLNLGKPRFEPKLWTVPLLPPAHQVKFAPPKQVSVQHRDRTLILENANLRLVLQLQPLMLTELQLLPVRRNVLVAPTPLFAIHSWDGKAQATSADYQTEKIQPERNGVTIHITAPNLSLPDIQLALKMDGDATLEMRTTLHNKSQQTQRWQVHLPAHWQLRISKNDFYTYPLYAVVISNKEITFHYRYSGWLPLQFLDLSAPELGIGFGLLTKDLVGFDRYIDLKRKGEVTRIGIRWRCDPVLASASLVLPPIEFFAHSGDWRQSFEHYKVWVQTWYQPLSPRKEWFRKVFAFRQDYVGKVVVDLGQEPLFDPVTKTYRFTERVKLVKKNFGACDYLHIFDWGATTYRGRTGDYDPWNDRLTSADEFKAAVTDLQRSGVPIGLYIEGYLVDEFSRIGKAKGREWALRLADGSIRYWPGSSEMYMCPGSEKWQDYLVSVYRRVREETGAMGFYIDQFGFCDKTCHTAHHGHPPDWLTLPGEGQLTRKIRMVLPPECIVYTECFPPDIHTVLQDGSFDYAIFNFQTRAHQWMPAPVRLNRFAFPDFKVLQIIVCDNPVGTNEEAVRQVFFNGDGYWLQGESGNWWQPETIAIVRKCFSILREHADAFAGDQCEPLVPTLVNGVFANRFEGERKTVWTLYNANWRSVNGEVLAIPHINGARYLDAWNGRELKPRIANKIALLPLTIEPHGVSCVVQLR